MQAGGSLTLRHVSVRNGRVTTAAGQTRGGGAILNRGTLTLFDSTVSGSQVLGDGCVGRGRRHLQQRHPGGDRQHHQPEQRRQHHQRRLGRRGPEHLGRSTATITNSTISGNYVVSTVATGHGGGLDLLDGTAVLRNSTLSGNAASTGGAALLADDDATVQGSIIANSLLSENCGGYPDLTDGGGNQADDDSCGTIPDTLSGLDPVLRDNGGPTMTHALLAGSSALLGAGACGLIKDQRRGAARRALRCRCVRVRRLSRDRAHHDTVLGAGALRVLPDLRGPNYAVIGPFGALTLVGGRDVELGDGFSVGLDAALTLEIDPDLIP